jgi:NADPH2:quinone reductase
MQAWQVVRYGPPAKALARVDVPALAEPGPGLVRVRVGAVSLNFNDVDMCYGRYPTIHPALPYTLGMDLCGVVDGAGPGLGAWLGRRIVTTPVGGFGGLAERAYAPADSLFEAPASLDDLEAAAFFIPFHTMHLALFRRAKLTAGETLLVHSGAGGLGSAALQLGVAAGARVFATAGSPEKVAFCEKLGAEVAIDYRKDDFVARVLELTGGRGVDVVCDLVGGPVAIPSWRCVAHEGRYLVAGFSSGIEAGEAGLPMRPVAKGNFSLVGVMLAYLDASIPGLRDAGFSPWPRAVGEEVHADLVRLLAEGRIRPIVGRRAGFDAVPEAYTELEERRTLGRSVIDVSRIA